MALTRWEDVERAASHDAILHAAVASVTSGDLTREEALIAAVLALVDIKQRQQEENAFLARVLPTMPGLPGTPADLFVDKLSPGVEAAVAAVRRAVAPEPPSES